MRDERDERVRGDGQATNRGVTATAAGRATATIAAAVGAATLTATERCPRAQAATIGRIAGDYRPFGERSDSPWARDEYRSTSRAGTRDWSDRSVTKTRTTAAGATDT